VKEKHLSSGANQNSDVQQNHPAETRLGNFRNSGGPHPRLISARNQQFPNAQDSDEHQQR
jgi:hypothetical protein